MTNDKTKRKQRKLNELGDTNPSCLTCGETEITALSSVKLDSKLKKLLEEHHIAGGHNGESITVCRNCHAKLSDNQLDWFEGTLKSDRTPEMKAVAFFMGLAALFTLLVVWCGKHAKTLYDFVDLHQKPERGK